MNIENEALRPDIIVTKKEQKALLIEVLIAVMFGLNDAENKKMTKHQDLKNEVRRSWKLKNAKVAPVTAGAAVMMIKNLTEILNIGAVSLGAHLVVAG